MAYAHLVKPGDRVDLGKIDPEDKDGLSKEEGLAKLEQLGRRICELQELLYAAKRHSLLIVLQGRDTSGKDGSIRRLSNAFNVQGTHVASFKVPTELELSHDFLWRIHSATPGKGEVAIFNRSHYEDVLVVRVHDIVPKPVWKARYAHINAFEKLLADSNTLILKFYLHISKEEQEERLRDREKEPDKAWKLSVGDWKERELWGDYTAAYEDALRECSTEHAPWRVIPANHKWFRDLAIAEAVIETLTPYEAEWRASLVELGTREKAALDAFRAEAKPK